jgi:hypothetical protein
LYFFFGFESFVNVPFGGFHFYTVDYYLQHVKGKIVCIFRRNQISKVL